LTSPACAVPGGFVPTIPPEEEDEPLLLDEVEEDELLDEVCPLEEMPLLDEVEEDEPPLDEVCPLEEMPLLDELDAATDEELFATDELPWLVPPPVPVDSPPAPPVPPDPPQLTTASEKKPKTNPSSNIIRMADLSCASQQNTAQAAKSVIPLHSTRGVEMG